MCKAQQPEQPAKIPARSKHRPLEAASVADILASKNHNHIRWRVL